MLKFAVVGNHGRDLFARIAACTVLSVMWIAPLASQTSPAPQDLLTELAGKITALVLPDPQASLTASTDDSSDANARALQDAITSLLASRGVRTVNPGEGITSIRVSCSQNLREQSCVGEVSKNAKRDVVMATRPLDGRPALDTRSPVTLEVRPLVAQQAQILDVANIGDRLLMLDSMSVAVYQQKDRGWERTQARPLPVSRTWPRDLRGRLRVEGDRFTAFLPGVSCTGSLNLTSLECAESKQPWPLGIENGGIDPSRNHFSTPEGISFYSAAALGADADARWLVVDRDGALRFLDPARQPLATAGAADDVAAIGSSCGTESYVVATETSEGRDVVRLLQVTRRRLVPIASPVIVPGAVTALWTTPAWTAAGTPAAVAIAHDSISGRYEAFLATVSCGR